MLQVWFINYKRTITDRFAFPDKSTTKSTKLKLFLLPPKVYKGASNWNKFHPDQTVVKLFAYSKAGLCASTVTELELDIDVETLQIMLILSNYWMQFYTFDY